MSDESKDFIKRCLDNNPETRLGATANGDFKEILSHPWFDNIDKDKLLKKELKAPYIPKFYKDSHDDFFD